MFADRDELLNYIKDEGVEFVDVRFCDLPGVMQHFTVPVSSFDEDVFDDGLMFDGSSIRGFQAIHESDMALFPDPTTAYLDPFRARQDAGRQLLHPRPADRRGLQPRPAQHRAQGAGVPQEHRHRRHRVLRAGGGVLRLRRRAVRDQAEHRLLLHRLDRRRLEHRPRGGRRQPRLQGQLQGRLLPGPAVRPLRRPARRDRQGARGRRPHRRARAPRGRHRRPGRDQLPVRRAAARRRQPDEVQVHRQERRVDERQDGDLHAEADLRRQRLGHALPPVALEGRRAAVLRRDRLWRSVRHRPATTSAACSRTPRRCWRSPTRR